MTRKRRRSTAEFNSEAVHLVAGGGKPFAQIARELGINEPVLRNGKRQAA